LKRYLEERISNAQFLFVAEALGYQGGRFTGIPMTSERIILGKQSGIDYELVFSGSVGDRTSNKHSPKLNRKQRQDGYAEPTATIVWKALIENNINPKQVLLWNIFPFHPYNEKKGCLSNRPPTQAELANGINYTKLLMEYCKSEMKILSIGKKSTLMLKNHGIESTSVRHPSMGGAKEFRKELSRFI
jgi:hypothetical protein